ncbi:MAG: hypothetical protein DRO95_00095 [Candidatus Altiarchaeales archaeon]|nr:MAG: hypothetical protein DRO95_00095 [Candidatus Altiarchaeales archaeon]HDO82798.1 hypothetical protein [Candidatus Altiarchaeales archaeon]HEX55447.1 hypothetical protein [Candidatus Altiarchaeales archaeon]
MVSDFLNDIVSENDIVLAPPCLWHLINCNVAHLHQAEAIYGSPTYDLGYINPERFVFNCSYENAKFIVFGNSTRGKTYVEQPPLNKIKHMVLGWRIYRVGSYIIYENPKR